MAGDRWLCAVHRRLCSRISQGRTASYSQRADRSGAIFGINLLIIFPQALRIAIPGLAGQFISLFKDTSLVAVVGMVDLMGISRSILANPAYLGRYAEVYLFVGAVYGLLSYGMAWVSYRIEQSIQA